MDFVVGDRRGGGGGVVERVVGVEGRSSSRPSIATITHKEPENDNKTKNLIHRIWNSLLNTDEVVLQMHNDRVYKDVTEKAEEKQDAVVI